MGVHVCVRMCTCVHACVCENKSIKIKMTHIWLISIFISTRSGIFLMVRNLPNLVPKHSSGVLHVLVIRF